MTWVTRTTEEAADAPSTARGLAEAVFDLARVPGQLTVQIETEPIENSARRWRAPGGVGARQLTETLPY